jgi:outer membrane protein
MKKALIAQLLLILLLPLGTFCQLHKGSYLGSFSANLAYNHNNYEGTGDYDYKTNTINFYFNSNMGLFVADRLAIGPGISFNIQYSQNTDEYLNHTYKSHSTNYGAAFNPFIRYYFASQGKLAFFVHGNGSIGYAQGFYTNEESGSTSQKTTINSLTFGGGAGIGLVYFITDNIGLETQLSYNYTGNNIKPDGDNTKSANSAIEIGLGLSFYFGKCKKQENDGNQKK